MRFKPALLFIAFAVFVSFGIWLFYQVVPFIGLKLISPQREQQLGEQLFRAMTADEQIDKRRTISLQQFTDQLQFSKQYHLRVHVVKSKEMNAYALPGGYIVVYSALLDEIETPEALAALLGHEASHINKRHSLRSMLKDAASGFLLSAIIGDAGGITGVLLRNADALRSLSYSRNLETEADTEGMNLLLKNQVNVSGMQQLLKTLQSSIPKNEINISFLSTHPLTEERLKTADDYIQSHKQSTDNTKRLLPAFRSLQSEY